jgi:hypothetical protein
MEALIPAPANCEERSVIKFLNALQKLRQAIQNKQRGMLSAGIVFLTQLILSQSRQCCVTVEIMGDEKLERDKILFLIHCNNTTIEAQCCKPLIYS